MKDLLQENREKKIKEAKFAKESNRLLRENLMMLKDIMMYILKKNSYEKYFF